MKSGHAKTSLIPFFRSNLKNDLVRGSIELTDEVALEDILSGSGEFSSIGKSEFGLECAGACTLCLLVTPALLIPCDLLRLFSCHSDNISSIQILQHSSTQGKYLSLINTRTATAAAAIVWQYHGKPLTSLDPTVALLYGVKEISMEGGASTDSIDNSFKIVIPPSEGVAAGTLPTLDTDMLCVLCLEGLAGDGGALQRSFTMCCGHTFHINCVMKLENPQCPVCRYRHEDIEETLSCCQDCGWFGRPPTSSLDQPTASMIKEQEDCFRMSNEDGTDNDLWLCLVCGFIGCGRSNQGHIHLHYKEHMHTYVMNTESRRVYDFAGGGYVHRLLLQSANDAFSNSAAPGEAGPGAEKLIESYNPRSSDSSGVRPAMGELSSEQEEIIVHRKLEAVAAQYNNILTMQLNRQRQMYEIQLKILDDKLGNVGLPTDPHSIDHATKLESPVNSGEWATKILTSLKAEKRRLMQQCDSMHGRITKCEKERSVLEALNQSLLKNQGDFKAMVTSAELELRDAELALRTELPPLERKVRDMMLQLEQQGPTEDS